MYRALRRTIRFLKEKGGVVVFSVENIGHQRWIHPASAAVLALFDGQNDDEQVRADIARLFLVEPGKAETIQAKVLRNFGDTLDTFDQQRASSLRYVAKDLLYEPEGPMAAKRLSQPIEVAWLITERCHCSCRYCCIRTAPAAAEMPEMSTEQALAFADDCVGTGVQKVFVHGGEPFLRTDTTAVIARLLAGGIFVQTSTKRRLARDMVRDLANAGLEELQLSIDTVRPELAEELIGIEGYLDRVAFPNLELLLEHGIRPRVNTVVMSYNVAEIPSLLRALAARGVRRFTLSGYLRGDWRHDDRHFAGGDALAVMAQQVGALVEQEGLDVELPPLGSPRDLSIGGKRYASCGGGSSGLVVGADGRVSLCDRLLPYPETEVGNVTRSSLMEIWQSPQLEALVSPDPEDFCGTACDGCDQLEACSRRIRCYHRALRISGRLFGPDYLCDVVPAPPIRYF